MSIAIIVPKITPRLSYTLDWVFVEQLGVSYQIFTELPLNSAFQLPIYYNSDVTHFSIPNQGLLFDEGVQQQKIQLGIWGELPTLFAEEEARCSIPFDLFSAVFFLLSRYEEYLPYTADKHERFPAAASILFKNNLLHRPIVDEWLFVFAQLLRSKGIETKESGFQFQPTFDIDIAWSYRYKGLKRTVGGYIRDMMQFSLSAVPQRTSVLLGKQKDPFDTFGFIEKCHRNDIVRPIYFILAAKQVSDFDKNISPLHPQMGVLIQRLAAQNDIGIHPSYYSLEKKELLTEEKNVLEQITNCFITKSRQHYIKVKLPETYRQLIENGIQQDYSMGYATHLGFRAGTSQAFFWYDLSNEDQTGLSISPFCFMDATAHYELKLSAVESFDQLKSLKVQLQKIGAKLTIIFHNFSLGAEPEWEGWKEQYQQFVQDIQST
jgi:hypothetical protein